MYSIPSNAILLLGPFQGSFQNYARSGGPIYHVSLIRTVTATTASLVMMADEADVISCMHAIVYLIHLARKARSDIATSSSASSRPCPRGKE